MQVQEKKQGLLITPFFSLELNWNNEYLTYIDTSFYKVTSSLDNSKKSLKTVIHNTNIKPLQRNNALSFV